MDKFTIWALQGHEHKGYDFHRHQAWSRGSFCSPKEADRAIYYSGEKYYHNECNKFTISKFEKEWAITWNFKSQRY